ncbi:uncharacterized protein LOC119671163 [Teleopsis dalmanni]|uniref:uncharacterized protein LOC119671163 n=1 Tax=Teleopsis dalmanni TaxID=139649 RepID=UPI0018CD2EBF|nr:uncharacterized protein LOC119671163 [Teleopsis dalmanni]
MKLSFLFVTLLLAIATVNVRADFLDCDEKIIPSLSDIADIGPKITSSETTIPNEHEVRDFFKNIGCQIKKGATKVKEQAKKWGREIKEGAKKLTEKAKDFGADIKTKLSDYTEKVSEQSNVENLKYDVFEHVEIINPDVEKAEQECGHGHILDALGKCSKLRK